jgi:enoyl-CoA hydratase/carnithine racemase
MAYETLLLTREDGFAVITLNRPPANAISEELIRELNAALNELRDDATVRALIITGAGDRIFCGGADLGSAFSGGDVEAFIRFGNSVMRKMERFPKPIIAAINGHAMGGGCEIAMACHLRLLKETARMGQTESNLGIIPGYGGTQRLPRLIGRTKALEFLLLGTQIPAAECLSLGLVNRLSKEGETLDDAKALARQLAARAPLATAAILEAVDEGLEAPMARSIDVEIDAFMPTLRSEDAAEGIQAFFAKRPPDFKGR